MSGKTFVATKASAEANRAWFVVDAAGKPLGRLASQIASVLRGKHKPTFTTHEDAGDFVVVVNADKIKLTGNKLDKKFYYHHSGIPGRLQPGELSPPPRAQAHVPDREGREGDASQERARPADADQAQDLRDAGPPARGSEARPPSRRILILLAASPSYRKKKKSYGHDR
jgi:hypothetical protein